jgi:ADP-ribose pyrophosphatase
MSGIYQGAGRLGRWQRLHSETLTQNRIFDVRKNTSRSPRTGQQHDFFVLETSDWVNIIPLTAAGEVVLIRQFRHGVEDFTLEIPGGMLDPEDTSPGEGARREMREETGYDSSRVEPLGVAHPNPAIQGNRCHMFVAHDCTLQGDTNFDTTEETEVLLAPLTAIPDLVQTGKISHALVLCAFHYLNLQKGGANP